MKTYDVHRRGGLGDVLGHPATRACHMLRVQWLGDDQLSTWMSMSLMWVTWEPGSESIVSENGVLVVFPFSGEKFSWLNPLTKI